MKIQFSQIKITKLIQNGLKKKSIVKPYNQHKNNYLDTI